jgi:hypothetical protein
MQHNEPVETGRPFGFYFLMLFLFFLTTMIGWNFGRVPGALIGFVFASIISTYALQIKLD